MADIPAFPPSRHPPFRRSPDHAEIARAVLVVLESQPVVWSDGAFWQHNRATDRWRPVHRSYLARLIMSFSGAPIVGSNCTVMVNYGTVTGVLRLLADLVDDPGFFADPTNRREDADGSP